MFYEVNDYWRTIFSIGSEALDQYQADKWGWGINDFWEGSKHPWDK